MPVPHEARGDIEPRSFLPRQRTIGEKIRYYADVQPGHPAAVASGFMPLSYRDVQLQVDDVRAALRRAGYGVDARIAVALPNGPQAALAIVAVSCAAASIPVNPRQTLPEIDKCLAALRPDAVLVLQGSETVAEQVARLRGIAVLEAVPAKEGALSFNLVEPGPAAAPASGHSEPEPDAIAFILQTSGTTADSKLIPTSHRNMLAAAARVQAWFNLMPRDRCLCVSPVFYAHGLHVTVFATLLSGGTMAFPADPSKLDYAEWFGDLRPTWLSAGPALHHLVLDQVNAGAAAKTKHSLRFVVSGGAPLPRDVLDGLQSALGVPVLEHYGSSEGMQICANQLPPGRSQPGTCGVPWPNTIRIVADDGGDVSPGEQGEILVGGPTVVSEYLDAPALTAAAFVDGWFRSGDIGSLAPDGFLRLHGRKNDLINRGGEKISPGEIDALLLRHPAIAEAAAFSVPHPRLGEDIAAAVVLRGDAKVGAFELRRYLQDQVASFKVPRRILIRDQLPKGATGKVLRRKLTESWQDEPVPDGEIVAPETADGKFIDLVVQLTAMWERLLKVAPLSLDDDFFERGGDSLLAVDMLAELEELTGKPVPGSILLDAPTIRQLALKLSELSASAPENLVKINPHGRKPPLILFHGDYIWGGGHMTLELTQRLGSDQPMLVVVPHGNGDAFPRSVEAMAAERLPLILNAQPEGPYRLCGYCLGGIVAFEVARMLRAAGKDVAVVVMIDSPTINARRSVQFFLSLIRRARPLFGAAVDRLMAWTWYRTADLQRGWNVSPARRWAATKKRLRFLVRKGGGWKDENASASTPVTHSSPLGSFTDVRTMKYAAAMSSYSPKPLAVRVVYIAMDYGFGGWRRLSPDCEVVKSPGTHHILNYPKIAEVLRLHLCAGR